MKENLREYARFGISQHMLYGVCKEQPEHHLKTLGEALQLVTQPGFLPSGRIEHIDVCVPVDEPYRSQAIDILNEYRPGIKFVYNKHLVPFMNFYPGASHGIGMDEILDISTREVDAAHAIGANHTVIAPGHDYPEDRVKAVAGLEEYMTGICDYIQKKGWDIRLLLEPFDRKFKQFLLGPSGETARFIKRLKDDGLPVGISLDMAHVPLTGETFEQAIETYHWYGLIEHVHIGNCVMRGDPKNPDYGDTHPALGIPEGEVGVPELERILKALLGIGYLSRENPGSITVESRPFPSMNEGETVKNNFGLLFKAWENLELQ